MGADAVTSWAVAARTDETAQAAFVRATQAEVWRLAATLVGPGQADDLVQETYLRAFRALDTFEARSSARTWLLGIARRVCADALRGGYRRQRLAARLSRQPASRPAADPADTSSLRDLLDRLSPEQRTAFVLTQVLGLSYAEAADVTGVPIGTIRSRIARARTDLVDAVRAAMAS